MPRHGLRHIQVVGRGLDNGRCIAYTGILVDIC